MKSRIAIVFIVLLCSLQSIVAQEYFVLVIKNDNQSFKFPENVVMNLIDENGKKRLIKKNDAITVKGTYSLKVEYPEIEKTDTIKINGGVLEIFVLPIDIRYHETYPTKTNAISDNWDEQTSSKSPPLESRELTKSKTVDGHYNILLVFENDLVFKYHDGISRAWEDGEEVEVSKNYVLATSKGKLKISYNPKTTDTWWIWE